MQRMSRIDELEERVDRLEKHIAELGTQQVKTSESLLRNIKLLLKYVAKLKGEKK